MGTKMPLHSLDYHRSMPSVLMDAIQKESRKLKQEKVKGKTVEVHKKSYFTSLNNA